MKKVTMYSTPTCPDCREAKDFLQQHNIDYTDYDVSMDEDRREEMIGIAGKMSVPTIVVEDLFDSSAKTRIDVGFNKEAVEEMLGV